MSTGFKCPICGAPTRVYMGNARKDHLCGKHADMLKKGELILDASGHFCAVAKDAVAKNEQNPFEAESLTEDLDFADESGDGFEWESGTCLVCGECIDADYLFCRDCYSKYKNKSLLLRISNCKYIKILDSSYEGAYTCRDGHIVKSKSELAIDNYLYEKKISHSYEPPFAIDNNPEHDLHPDFYLPEMDLYIEHWGYDESNRDYTKKKEYKLHQYEKAQITLVCTDESDMQNISANLDRKLKFYQKGKINY